MTAKERYRELCEALGSCVPIFQQHWWMEAVCAGKEWDVALTEDTSGRITAALPYLLRKRLGMRYVLQPQLTMFNGPLLLPPNDMSDGRRTDFAHQACERLIDQIEGLKLDYYCQRFSPEITDWLPFHWRGYNQTTRYTYRIDDISDPRRVFEGFDRTKERQRRIRRIIDQYTVDTTIDAATFTKFHTDYWHSRGESELVPPSLMQSVIEAATKRNQGLTLGLRDGEGKLAAAWFAVYDENCAYALLSAKGMDERQADVSALAIWRLIEALSGRTKAFDFEGSIEKNLEYFYRSFGARQVPIMEVCKPRNPLFPLLKKLHR